MSEAPRFTYVIGLGANLGDRALALAAAVDRLTSTSEVSLLGRSRLHQTLVYRDQIAAQASSFTDIKQGPGSLAVYGRRGQPCRRCGTPVRMRLQGEQARSTYWCPSCQAPVLMTHAPDADGAPTTSATSEPR